MPSMPASYSPKVAYHPLELLTRRGASQAEIAQRLGITVEEVVKVRRRLRLLNWVIVGAAFELVRRDRRPRFQEEYTRQIQEAVARKMGLRGGDVKFSRLVGGLRASGAARESPAPEAAGRPSGSRPLPKE